MSIVSLKNISVEFPVFKGAPKTFASKVLGGKRSVEMYKALDNISCELNLGDRVVLKGNNGAGKTTFLRVVGGILPPTKGQIVVNGTVLPLIQRTPSVINEASCHDNVVLNGLRNKISGNDLKEYVEHVKDLSELEKFWYGPVNALSSGMRNRFVLSMLYANPADVVVMDEWIGTSDAKVLEKTNGMLEKLISQCKVFLLATHSEKIANDHCNKVIELESGQIKSFKELGKADE